MGASGGTSRLPVRFSSRSSPSAASIGSLSRAARNCSAPSNAGANLRSVAQRPAARTSESSSARSANASTSPRTRSSLGQPTASSTASKASRSPSWAAASAPIVPWNRRISRPTSRVLPA